MGSWISCQKCAGTGTIPCACAGRDPHCPRCNASGVVSCSDCSGCGAIYVADQTNQDEYEFAYDEY